MVAFTSLLAILAAANAVTAVAVRLDQRNIIPGTLKSKLVNTHSGDLCLCSDSSTGTDSGLKLISCDSPLAKVEFHNDDSALLSFPGAHGRVAEVTVGSHTASFVKLRPQVDRNSHQRWVISGVNEYAQLKPVDDTSFCLEVQGAPPATTGTMVKPCDSSNPAQWFKFT